MLTEFVIYESEKANPKKKSHHMLARNDREKVIPLLFVFCLL